jgi:tetratricopeptide (TPR) repeat protein
MAGAALATCSGQPVTKRAGLETVWLATCRLLGRFDDALIEYDLLIEAGADSATYSRRGQTYMRLERYDQALADLDRALDLDAGNLGAMHCRAETYRLTGRLDEALSDYDRAIEQAPDDADLIAGRAEVLLAMSRSEARPGRLPPGHRPRPQPRRRVQPPPHLRQLGRPHPRPRRSPRVAGPGP